MPMDFPEFNDAARAVLEFPDDSYLPEDLRWITEWPDHAARALDKIANYEDGRRPRAAWIRLLRKQMREDGMDE